MPISKWIKEPFCGLSHFAGSLLSIAGLVVLLVMTRNSAWHYVSFAVYGTTLIVVFTASGLVHSLYCSAATEDKLERLDYAAIFALIAGTYTPLCLTALRGPWGWSLFGVEWAMAVFGIIAVLMTKTRPKRLTTPLYLIMGWMAIIAAGPLTRHLPIAALVWLLLGGAAYSIGAVIFTLNRPILWPGRFGAHDLWHSLVLTGSACHFVVMLWFIA